MPLAGLPRAIGGRSPLSRSRMTPVVRKARRQPDAPCRLPVPMPVADEADNPAGTFCRNRLARSCRPLCLAGRGARKPPFQTSQSGGSRPRSGDPEATFPGRLARPPCPTWQTKLLASSCPALQHHPFRHRSPGRKGQQMSSLSLPPLAKCSGNLVGRPALRGRGGPSVTPLGQGPNAPGAIPSPGAGAL